MAENPYTAYYVNQAGNGYGSFEGVRYQRGKGFFGSVLRNAALPLLKYLGRQVLRTGVDIAGDVIEGEPLKEALKTRGKARLREIADDGVRRAQVFAQTGRGRKHRKINLNRKRNLKKKQFVSNRREKSNTSARIPDLF